MGEPTSRPQVIANDCYLFTLMVERTELELDAGLYPQDDGTVRRFMLWLWENAVPQLKGGASGPGFFTGAFPIAEKQRILDWCVAEGLLDAD